MLKTLRIASFLTLLAAAATVVMIAVFGLRGNPEIEAFLNREGIVAKFRDKAATAPAKSGTTSPLELAAKAFALRIDPPPPPTPPPPKNPPKRHDPTPPVEIVKPPMEIKRPPVSAKFTLVATARYPEQPQKSMALLKSLQNEYAWYRQGDQVGHQLIQEVKDGSVVLFQNGRYDSEIYMPEPPKAKSLLKGDNEIASAPQGPSGFSTAIAEGSVENQGVVITAPETPGSDRPSVRRTIPPRITALRDSRPAIQTPSRVSRPVRSVSPPTKEEQKESITDSISSIQEIMKQPPLEGQTEEERQQEQEAWKQLLTVLQQERENIDQAGEETSEASSEQAEQPDQSDSSDSKAEKSGKIR